MNIVLGYAEAGVAERAIAQTVKYAKAFGATVYVVLSMVGGRDIEQEVFTHTEELLDKLRERFQAEGVPCDTRLLARGLTPGEDIVQFAEDVKAEQIVIGIKRTSKVGKMLFGSNAQYVILNAPCPVLTVR